MKTAAIILAAGFSSRMGQDKALLPLGEMTALELLVCSYQQAGVAQIIVVTGSNHAAVAQLSLKVKLLQNPAPEAGMFSSIQTGVAELNPEVEAFFVHPVDIPLVTPHTLELLVTALLVQAEVFGVIPVYDGKRGHPPLFPVHSAGAILAYIGTDGLRGLLSRNTVVELPVGDQGVLLGMNTPQQYEVLQQFLAMQQLKTHGDRLWKTGSGFCSKER